MSFFLGPLLIYLGVWWCASAGRFSYHVSVIQLEPVEDIFLVFHIYYNVGYSFFTHSLYYVELYPFYSWFPWGFSLEGC